jgi:Tfp pilus assembly protein PilV
MKKSFTNKGFMIIEILIAISIITASILATMAVAQKSVYISRQSLHATQAAFLLEEGAEAMRLIRDDAWSNISSLSLATEYFLVFDGSTWSLSPTPASIGGFTRTVRLSGVERDDTTKNITGSGSNDPETKLVTVEVSWNEGGVAVEKNLQFYLMNIFDDSEA